MSLFRRKRTNQESGTPTPQSASTETGPTRRLPPHLQRLLDDQAHRQPPASARDREAKRQELLYDIEQGELATQPDNPWSERAGLLGEALEQIEADIAEVRNHPPSPYAPFPPTPVTGIRVSGDDAKSVSVTIGKQEFTWTEVLDWSERGHQLAAPELVLQAGDVGSIDLASIPAELRGSARHHLADSLAVFAADMRDRALEHEEIPGQLTLADFARPCSACGGWTDWRGRCDACAARKGREHQLLQERTRLLDERAAQAEERHRLIERLPLARRRLADFDARSGLR